MENAKLIVMTIDEMAVTDGGGPCFAAGAAAGVGVAAAIATLWPIAIIAGGVAAGFGYACYRANS